MITEERLARDQDVGEKPEGTGDADFREFEQSRRKEREEIDVSEGRLAPRP